MFYLPEWREGLEPCLLKKDTRYWIDPKGIFLEEIGRSTECAQVLAAYLRSGRRIVVVHRTASRTQISSVMEHFGKRLVMVVGWHVNEVPITRYDQDVWSLVLGKRRLRIEDLVEAGWNGDVRTCVDILLRGGTLALIPILADGISATECIVCSTYKGRGI